MKLIDKLTCVFLFVSIFITDTLNAQNRLIKIVEPLDIQPSSIVKVGDKYLLYQQGNEIVYLVSDNGEIAKIDARKSYPGFNWKPLAFKAVSDSVLFFTNSAPFGAFISTSNRVLKVLGREFMAPEHFEFSETEIGGWYGNLPFKFYFRVSDSEGKTKWEVDIFTDTDRRNAVNRFFGGDVSAPIMKPGILFGNHWLLTNGVEPFVYCIDAQTQKVTKFRIDLKTATWLTRDWSDDISFMQKDMLLMKKSSFVSHQTPYKDYLVLGIWHGKLAKAEIVVIDLKTAKTISSGAFTEWIYGMDAENIFYFDEESNTIKLEKLEITVASILRLRE